MNSTYSATQASQDLKAQLDAAAIKGHQKITDMQKAHATQMAKKNHQLKSAGKNLLGYHEMLHKISKDVGVVEEAHTKSQRDASASRKSASQKLTKLRDMKGKYADLRDNIELE